MLAIKWKCVKIIKVSEICAIARSISRNVHWSLERDGVWYWAQETIIHHIHESVRVGKSFPQDCEEMSWQGSSISKAYLSV